MLHPTQIAIPSLVRVKEDALRRVGLYLSRSDLSGALVFHSQGLIDELQERLRTGLQDSAVDIRG